MKKFCAFLCALMTVMSVEAAQQITIANYSVNADVENQAVFYALQEADFGRTFNFYIYIEEGRHDIVWGKTYTLADMNGYYCYWMEDATTGYGIVQASFTKTKGEGYAVRIVAHVMDTEGEEFDLTYAEEPVVLTGDTVRVRFEKQALVERNTNGTWQIEASNDTLGGRVTYYSLNPQSCAGSFAGDEVYLISCYVNVFTGRYEYDFPVYDRVFAKDASVQVIEDETRIEAHAVMVGENGVVYDFTMAFEKPVVADQVTITSDSLVIDATYYSMFGTVQLSAADEQHKVILWFEPAGLDSLIAGTYVVGEKQFDGWVIHLETGKETSLYSGSITVTYDDGAYSVEGAVLCKNNVEYTLHLSLAKPTPTREETLVFARVPMSMDETGWGAYGESADHTKYISISSPSTTVAGHYTENELNQEYSFVGTDLDPEGGKTNQYYRMMEADLTVTFDDVDSVAHITGTLFCINTQNPNDRPLFTIDVTTAMDSPFFDDATDNFSAAFATYAINDLMVEDVGSVLVEAYNEADGAFVALQLFVAEGATRLSAGTYPISATEAPMTALASRGLYAAYATYSIAGYANENNRYSQIWFLVSGMVTVKESGAIEVEALNSNGKTVHCTLDRAQGIDNVQGDNVPCTKVLRDGQLYLMHNGTMYNVQGIQIK